MYYGLFCETKIKKSWSTATADRFVTDKADARVMDTVSAVAAKDLVKVSLLNNAAPFIPFVLESSTAGVFKEDYIVGGETPGVTVLY